MRNVVLPKKTGLCGQMSHRVASLSWVWQYDETSFAEIFLIFNSLLMNDAMTQQY